MFNSPFLHSSYYDPYEQYNPYYAQSQAQQRLTQQRALEQQRAQRLRRAQYLPDEDEDSDEGSYQLTPREQFYLDAKRRQEALERRRREAELLEQKQLETLKQEAAWREQELKRREHLIQAHRQHQAQRQNANSPSSIPSRTRSRSPPIPKKSPPPEALASEPRPTTPLAPEDLERHNECAAKIQAAYRVHRAISAVKDLEHQFNNLKESFSPPPTIDFQGPDGIISVAVSEPLVSSPTTTNTPKLAYNSTNSRLHAYVEALSRLLLKLDGIESWGDASVRKSRRRVVGKVEGEASKVDSYWKAAWANYASRKVDGPQSNEQEDETMGEDSTSHDTDGQS